MIKAVIIYAPDNRAYQKTAKSLKHALVEQDFLVESKVASQAAITDLTAADLVILGSGIQGKEVIHPDFSEIVRALEGINLAPRLAGLFSLTSEKTIKAFKQRLKDSGITVCREVLISAAGESPPARELETWVAGLISTTKDRFSC